MEKILLLDNYDSFTFNLYHLIQKHYSGTVEVLRDYEIENDVLSDYSALIISPGPGRPETTPKVMALLEKNLGKLPILGVCLGMQCINAYYGGVTIESGKPIHGKRDEIQVDNSTRLFSRLPESFTVARYHSLVIETSEKLTITAKTRDMIVMGIEDREKRVYGVQFHPESFLSEYGDEIIKNFLRCLNG